MRGQESEWKCKVTGDHLGTNDQLWLPTVVCGVHTAAIMVWVVTNGGRDWIAMASPVTKTCIPLWPGHGQLRVEDARYTHQRTEWPVPVPPLCPLFSLYYSSFSTPCPLTAVITLFYLLTIQTISPSAFYMVLSVPSNIFDFKSFFWTF